MKKIFFLLTCTILAAIILSGCQFPSFTQNVVQDNNVQIQRDSQVNGSDPTIAESSSEEPQITQEADNDHAIESAASPTPEREENAAESTKEAEEATQEVQENETESPPAEEKAGESSASGAATAEEAELPKDVGPTDFPEGINPLTGLRVDDPALLDLPPALLSVSNFPASARPQAGLNSSAFTFEMTIGEGMTRFLALFYGEFPQYVSGQTEGQSAGAESTAGTEQPAIGPIRSGRLPYEDLRASFNGFLVMASAYSGVAQTLSDTTSIYGSDADDINSALIDIDKLYEIALAQAERAGQPPYLEGLRFSETPPEGGTKAEKAWIFYNSLNQIQWEYDPTEGAYIRYDIKTDGSNAFPVSTDRLTGEPISKENVIVIFAMHNFIAPTLIDIQLANMPPMKALLFRDGQMYEIFWTTKYGDYEKETGLTRPIRFVDAEGNPVPLKPGQTWVHIVTDYSYSLESAISDNPFYGITEESGTGLWLIRYKGKY